MDEFIKNLLLDTKISVTMENGHQHTGRVQETDDPAVLVIYSEKHNPCYGFKPYGLIYMRVTSVSHIIIHPEGE